MNILVIFPKEQCYSGKDGETQRLIDANVNKWLNRLINLDVNFTYRLEDLLAVKFLSNHKDHDDEIVSCICKNDLTYLQTCKDKSGIDDSVFDKFETVKHLGEGYRDKWVVPFTVIREGPEVYEQKMLSACKRRIRAATDTLITNSNVVLMFRCYNNNDNTTALSESLNMGDGRLCIEVNINTGVSLVYYGGTFISDEYIETILTM